MSTVTATPFTAEPQKRLRQLEEVVTERLTSEWRWTVPQVLVRRAVREAVEVAQETAFPELFLPELASEQVRRISGALGREPVTFVAAA